jgi:glutamate-1-semialdehyde aminotransferase
MAAAVGSAALELLRDGSVQDYTAELATELRTGLNAAMRDAGVAGCAYGLRSCFRFIVGDPDDLPDARDGDEFLTAIPESRLLAGTRPHLREALHQALFLEGLDILAGNHGWLSQAHAMRDVQMSVEAFARALGRVIDEGGVKAASRSAAGGRARG